MRRGPRVEIVDPEQDARWDRFVREHPGGTVYHLSAWATILARAYRFEPRYLALPPKGGHFRGLMPLVVRKTPMRGGTVASLPWMRAGGPLAADDAAEEMLLEAACDLADERAWRLTVDSAVGGLDKRTPRLVHVPCLPTWIADLPVEDELVSWFAGRSKNLRRGVKRARDRGVRVRISDSEADLKAFFRIYLRTMRKHRSLPRPWRQLSASRRLLGRDVFRLFVAEVDCQVVAGSVFHVFGETMELLYNASDERFLDRRPNHALYAEAIEWGARNGIAKLDYGVAPAEGSLAEFKRQWGGVEVARHCYEYDPGGSTDGSVGSEARMMENRADLIDRLWGRAPLPLTRLAGIVSYRYL